MGAVQQVLAGFGAPASGSYRYWRLFVVNNQGDPTYISIADVEWALSPGGADQTTPSTPTSQSASLAGLYPAANTVDDAVGTYWIPGAADGSVGFLFSQWASYDFASPVALREIRMRPQTGATSRMPNAFRVEGSTNNTDWTVVQAFASSGPYTDNTFTAYSW